MNEPAPKPTEKKKIWIQVYDNEETEQRLRECDDLDDQTKEALLKLRMLWGPIRFGEPIEVPPAGDYFYPPDEEEDQPGEPPPVEQVEDRVVVTHGEPKVTRTRRRVVAVRPRKRLPWVTDEDLARARNGDDDGKPGPKPLLDDAGKEQVCMYLTVGLSRALTARELGVSTSTLSRTIKRDPEFKRRVLQAEAKYERNRVLALLQAARDSWRAGAWMFKNYHPHLSVRRLNRRSETRFTAEAVEKISAALDVVKKAG
jgi:hypothetical protein